MIVGIAASGRKRGNSARLLQEALGAAEAKGADTCTHDLGDLSYRGCVGCAACRTSSETCVLRDDLTEVLAATAGADALVLAAPIYYGYPNGLFKAYLDRWYSFRDGERKLRVPQGRRALLVLTQGHPDASAYSWTVESLRKTLAAYGLEPEVFVAPGLESANAADRAPALLAEAARLGSTLTRWRPG